MGLFGVLAAGCSDDTPQCADGACTSGSTGTAETDTDPVMSSGLSTTDAVDSTGADSSGETGPTCECGEGEVCVAGTCTPIENEQCEVLWAPEGIPLEQTVRLGLLMPRESLAGSDFEGGVRVAAQLLTELTADQAPAWIVCDTESLPEQETAGAQHLVETGVVGLMPVFVESPVDAIANAAGVMTLSTEVLPSSPDPLRWSMAHAPVYEAAAVGDRVPLSGPAGGPGETLIFGIDDERGQAWADALLSRAEGSDPVVTLMTDPAELPTLDDLILEITMAIDSSWAANGGPATNVIFTGEFTYEFIASYLALWSIEGSPDPFPRFLVTTTDSASLEDVVMGVLKTPTIDGFFEPLRDTIESTEPGVPDPAVVADLEAGYQERFGEGPSAVAALAYDAARAMNLAACARAEDSGTALAEVLSRLNGQGEAETDFGAQCEHLAAGGSLSAGGASGSLTWDPDRQQRRDHIWGHGFVPPGTTPAPLRQYVLDPPPAESGTWIDR